MWSKVRVVGVAGTWAYTSSVQPPHPALPSVGMTPTPDPNMPVALFRVAFSLAWRLSPGSDLVLTCTWLLLDQVTLHLFWDLFGPLWRKPDMVYSIWAYAKGKEREGGKSYLYMH